MDEDDRTERVERLCRLVASDPFFELTVDLLCLLDMERRILCVNPSLARLLGVEACSLAGRPVADFVHPDDQTRARLDLERVLAGEEPRGFEFRIHTAEGEERWLRWNCHPDTELGVLYAAAQDVTDQHRERETLAEAVAARAEELARREAIFRGAIRSTHGVPYEIRFEPGTHRGEYVFIDVTIEELVGLPAKGLKQEDLVALIDEVNVTAASAPDDFEQYCDEVIRGDRDRYVADFRLRTPAGETKWISDHAMVIHDPATGRAIGCLGILQDITERRMAQEALRQSEQRHRLLFEQAKEAIFISDLEDRILDANSAACRLFGHPREKLLTMGVHEMIAPEERRARGQRIIQWELKHHAGQPFETIDIDAHGRRIPVEVTTSLIQGGGGEVALSIVRDISERRRVEQERRALEAKVQEAQRLESLGVMAGGIAHDFNNLLLGIMGNVELVRDDLPPGSPLMPMLDDAMKSTQRATVLTHQMLAYAGKGTYHIEPVMITGLLTSLESEIQPHLPPDASLHFDLASNTPVVRGDPAQLREVILSLAMNAVEALPGDGGSVTIRAMPHRATREMLSQMLHGEELPEGPYALIEVIDDGLGMDRATQERIFDPFYSTKFAGRGLGLAATLGLVRGHAGCMGVTSTAGEGTTVRVLLPSEAMTARGAAGREGAAKEQRPAILVVDDEMVARRVAKRILEAAGHRVEVAADGREAERVLRERPDDFAAVLLDITMPHGGAAAALPRLLALRPELPIVLTSGYTERGVQALPMREKSAGFIKKPYRAADLVEVFDEFTR